MNREKRGSCAATGPSPAAYFITPTYFQFGYCPWGNIATGLGWNYTSPETMERLTDKERRPPRLRCTFKSIHSHMESFLHRNETRNWCCCTITTTTTTSISSSRLLQARNARRHLEQHCTQCKMQTGCFGCCVSAAAATNQSWFVIGFYADGGGVSLTEGWYQRWCSLFCNALVLES